MKRNLNVAAALLFASALMPIFNALLMLFSGGSEFNYQELIGVTITQISDLSPRLAEMIALAIQTRGLYLLIFALLWAVISLIPYRNGEKWAWYAILGIGSIWLSGYLILVYIGVKQDVYLSTWLIPGIIWTVLWMVGLALPAKEVLNKPSS